jgi:hypothetical protein
MDAVLQPDPSHVLIGRKSMDLDFVAGLPEEKSVLLLAILTHTGMEDCDSFREQLSFVFTEFKQYRTNLVTYRDLARIFNCHVGSIEYQAGRLKGLVRPVSRPKLRTPEAYQMIIRLVV